MELNGFYEFDMDIAESENETDLIMVGVTDYKVELISAIEKKEFAQYGIDLTNYEKKTVEMRLSYPEGVNEFNWSTYIENYYSELRNEEKVDFTEDLSVGSDNILYYGYQVLRMRYNDEIITVYLILDYAPLTYRFLVPKGYDGVMLGISNSVIDDGFTYSKEKCHFFRLD